MSSVAPSEANALAYKSMNPKIYYSVTLSLYLFEVFLACILTNIGPIFGYIATFAGCGLCYFLPSYFVIVSFKKYATPEYVKQNAIWVKIAYINFIMGIGFFFLFLANNILGFINFGKLDYPDVIRSSNNTL